MNSTKKLRIVGWTKYNENQEEIPWEDELEYTEAERLVEEECRKNGYKFGGTYHQQGDFGIPVFSDGRVMLLSMHSWGDLMSRIWGGSYMDLAWVYIPDDGGKVPTKKAKFVKVLDEEQTKSVEDDEDLLRVIRIEDVI